MQKTGHHGMDKDVVAALQAVPEIYTKTAFTLTTVTARHHAGLRALGGVDQQARRHRASDLAIAYTICVAEKDRPWSAALLDLVHAVWVVSKDLFPKGPLRKRWYTSSPSTPRTPPPRKRLHAVAQVATPQTAAWRVSERERRHQDS